MLWVKPWRSLALLSLALGASACAVGPNYHAPQTPTDAGAPFVSATSTVASADQPPADWWRPLRRSHPRRPGAAGADREPGPQVAAANLLKASGVLAQARAGLFPTTDLSVGEQWGRSSKRSAGRLP
ncbi:MAG: hypothetical protein WDM85_03375 [Caulobacteraceae bacterium]